MMNLNDLMDMKLKDILENYCVLWNYECSYPYGICSQEVVERMYEEYDVQSYWEAMTTEPIIDFQILEISDKDLISWEKIEIIMDNLGIMRKDEQV